MQVQPVRLPILRHVAGLVPLCRRQVQVRPVQRRSLPVRAGYGNQEPGYVPSHKHKRPAARRPPPAARRPPPAARHNDANSGTVNRCCRGGTTFGGQGHPTTGDERARV